MKILLVHNHYGSSAPSGENRVFELERDMLRRNGHDVETFERFSDDLRSRGVAGAIAGGLMTPWNPFAARAMAEATRRFRPDIVHAHNTFPMISPAVFAAAQGAGRVLTLHNYRLVCSAAIPMRDGQVCTECIDRKSVWPALRHGCYRSSRVATLPVALNIGISRWRRTWHRDVERFIALSVFQRETMLRAGLPRERIVVKPNFYPGKAEIQPYCERQNRAVFVGRVGAEKGIQDLVEAWGLWGSGAPELRIVGDGPLRSEMQSRAARLPNVVFLGQVTPKEAEREIALARMVILPSRWFETFGMVLLEAFRMGTPVAVSDVGPLPDLVDDADGLVFVAGDPANLFACVSERWHDKVRLARMSEASAAVFQSKYSETENHRLLLEIYDQALRARS